MVPCGSICASTRIARLLRKITPPCALTVPVHLSVADDWTAPFVILRVSGACSRGHCLPWAVLFDTCADTPAYFPSNCCRHRPGGLCRGGHRQTRRPPPSRVLWCGRTCFLPSRMFYW